jgi:hypothetical protein
MREAYRLNKQNLLWFAHKRKVYLSLVFLFRDNENTDVRKVKLGDIQKDVQRVLEAARAIE